MTSRADIISQAVLDQFEKLPLKQQPKIRDNGLHEWVPLSGIVAEVDGQFTCVSLATGMKCLPSSKLPYSNGVGIHDWHAEILAIRAFNSYILDECQKLLQDGTTSKIIQNCERHEGDGRLFQIREDVRLHMYCSEAPCGDASMELTMAAQDDASPWDLPPTASAVDAEGHLPGRAYFSQLGVVRRKPARGDAPPTLSKSCSDKLALKQCTSLLSSLTSLLVRPANAYIDTVVLPQARYSEEACRRAFSENGRMEPLAGMKLHGAYAFVPFSVATTNVEFRYSRTAVKGRSDRIAASNAAAAWSASGLDESIIGGVIQGRKPFDTRGASRMSRRRMWVLTKELAAKLNDTDVQHQLSAHTYRDVKTGPLLVERRQMKVNAHEVALKGWVKNEGDSDFSIDDAVHKVC